MGTYLVRDLDQHSGSVSEVDVQDVVMITMVSCLARVAYPTDADGVLLLGLSQRQYLRLNACKLCLGRQVPAVFPSVLNSFVGQLFTVKVSVSGA